MPTLCAAVVPEQCSCVRKPPDTLLVKLRKAEGDEWGSLDDSAAKKKAKQEEKVKANEGKSTAQLLSEMYADADEEGKDDAASKPRKKASVSVEFAVDDAVHSQDTVLTDRSWLFLLPEIDFPCRDSLFAFRLFVFTL